MCECPICLQDINLPKILGCGHVYCNNCITDWYNVGDGTYRQCPICQSDLTGEEFIRESDVTVVAIENIELPVTIVRIRRNSNVGVSYFKKISGLFLSTIVFYYTCLVTLKN